MVDESQQYDSLEAHRKQHKQPKEHIPLETVLEYHNPSTTFEGDYTETSFHSSDDSNQ